MNTNTRRGFFLQVASLAVLTGLQSKMRAAVRLPSAIKTFSGASPFPLCTPASDEMHAQFATELRTFQSCGIYFRRESAHQLAAIVEAIPELHYGDSTWRDFMKFLVVKRNKGDNGSLRRRDLQWLQSKSEITTFRPFSNGVEVSLSSVRCGIFAVPESLGLLFAMEPNPTGFSDQVLYRRTVKAVLSENVNRLHPWCVHRSGDGTDNLHYESKLLLSNLG